MIIAADAVSTHRSWSWLVAALVAYGLFLFFAPLLKKIKNPSPTRALPRGSRLKAQATVGVTEDEPAEPEIGWWGRIVEIGGVRFRQAKQVMATGSHELPSAEDDVDVPLDDDDDEEDREPVAEYIEPVAEYIARARGLKVPYTHIVRVVVEHYGFSESTAKRRIREYDQSRGSAAA